MYLSYTRLLETDSSRYEYTSLGCFDTLPPSDVVDSYNQAYATQSHKKKLRSLCDDHYSQVAGGKQFKRNKTPASKLFWLADAVVTVVMAVVIMTTLPYLFVLIGALLVGAAWPAVSVWLRRRYVRDRHAAKVSAWMAKHKIDDVDGILRLREQIAWALGTHKPICDYAKRKTSGNLIEAIRTRYGDDADACLQAIAEDPYIVGAYEIAMAAEERAKSPQEYSHVEPEKQVLKTQLQQVRARVATTLAPAEERLQLEQAAAHAGFRAASDALKAS